MSPFQGERREFESRLPLFPLMETRRCGSCGTLKPSNEFSFRNRILRIRHTSCKECNKKFKRAFYERHLESYKKRSARDKVESIRRNRERLREYLTSHPCVDCGESDPVVLHFDHIHDKHRGISQLVIDGVSWDKIEREIGKCEVRCANCHRKKTAREKGWYRKLGL